MKMQTPSSTNASQIKGRQVTKRPDLAEPRTSKVTLVNWVFAILVLLGIFWFVNSLSFLSHQPDEAVIADVPAICAVQGPDRAGVVTPPPLYVDPPKAPSEQTSDFEATVTVPDGFYALAHLHSGEMFHFAKKFRWAHHSRAAEYYEAAAEQGHDQAQFHLAFLYAEGDGVPRDADRALYWFQRAAEQGLPGAMCRMGEIFARGEGVSKDTEQAAKWFRKAAEKEYTLAQFWLAFLYYTGDGVPRNRKKAAQWFHKAAERGHEIACYDLGLMYLEGDGLKQDRVQALEWFRRAAEQGHPEAQYHLGLLYEEGTAVPPDAHKAAYWFLKAANQGLQEAVEAIQRDAIRTACADNVRRNHEGSAYQALLQRAQAGDAGAQHDLGTALAEGGFGLQKDAAQAVQWFRKAAAQGHAAAQLQLARMCRDGTGVPQDKAEAAVWYRKAAEQDDVEAQKALAHMYHTGDGIPRDVAQAIHWYRKLAERRDDKEAGAALNTLGKIHAAGDGVPRDMAQAVRCFREAALRDDDEAPSQLARLYAAGDGVPRDMGKALLWQHWALWRGDEHALRELARLHAGGDGLPCDTPLAAAWYYRLSEEASQSADALDALRTLGVDLADLRKYSALIHRLLKIRMTAARAELALEAAETDLTARGTVRMAALCAALLRLVPDPAAELASLEADGRKYPPIIRQMVAAVFAGVPAIEREALFTLGRMYDKGDGVPRDLYESLYCYHQGARLGDSRAQAELTRLIPDLVPSPGTAGEARPKDNDMASGLLAEGYALWNGDGMPEDREQAVARFYKAMEYGSAEAARILIRCSFLGKGTQQSDVDTMFYLFMYEALRDETKPLSNIEVALRRYCDQTLAPKVVQEQWQRRNDVFTVIRQRVWF